MYRRTQAPRNESYDLSGYPQELVLPDGTLATLRLIGAKDTNSLLAFLQEVPAEECFSLDEEAISPHTIGRWVAELDHQWVLPLVVLVDGRVIAEAALQRSRSSLTQHTGEIHLVVHPSYKGLDIETAVIHRLMTAATEISLELLAFRAIRDRQEGAIAAARWLGFTRLALLTGWVRDLEGRPLDVVLLEARLRDWSKWRPFRIAFKRVQVSFPYV